MLSISSIGVLEWYQNLPMSIDPIVLTIGFFALHWYAVCFLLGIGSVYFFAMLQADAGQGQLGREILIDGMLVGLIGALVGARLGYAFFYAFSDFWKNPLWLIMPFDLMTGEWIGIRGMSFFGGAIGITAVLIVWSWKNKIIFWQLIDVLALTVPLGIFWGRIGNFLNGELIGKTTTHFWGMRFLIEPHVLRHPAQLYEAAGEGLVLFGLLWLIRKKSKFPGWLSSMFLIFYGFIRFSLEWFRDNPDEALAQTGLTRGHVLAIISILLGIAIYHWKKGLKSATLAPDKQ